VHHGVRTSARTTSLFIFTAGLAAVNASGHRDLTLTANYGGSASKFPPRQDSRPEGLGVRPTLDIRQWLADQSRLRAHEFSVRRTTSARSRTRVSRSTSQSPVSRRLTEPHILQRPPRKPAANVRPAPRCTDAPGRRSSWTHVLNRPIHRSRASATPRDRQRSWRRGESSPAFPGR